MGTTIGDIKGDTRSLDINSYDLSYIPEIRGIGRPG